MFQGIFDKVRIFGARVIEIIKDVGVRFGKDKSGKTLGSLYKNVKYVGEEQISLEIFGSKVFQYIEDGREKGAKLPPSDVLKEFMRKVGIPEEAEWGVRYNISKFGIDPVPLLETSFIEISRDFKNALTSELGIELGKEIARASKKGFTFGNIRF